MTPDPAYTKKIAFYSKDELKTKLEEYAEDEGVTPSVICRKALVKYLKDKGVLDKNKKYL
jgi:predicted transcriptional regulator